MQGPPQFTQSLEDQEVTSGSSARLSCHLTGTSGFLFERFDALLQEVLLLMGLFVQYEHSIMT